MYAFLIVIHVIASIVLILVILLQAGRGGGLSESFGMSSTQTFFGTSATKFLQNATSACAVIFLMTCLSLAALSTQRSRSLMERQRFNETAARPVKPEPVKPEPAAAQPAKTEPAKTEPAKTEPAKTEPAKAETEKVPAPAR